MSTPMQKKPFHDPELVVYGDIRSITQSNLVGGKNDNAMGSNKTV